MYQNCLKNYNVIYFRVAFIFVFLFKPEGGTLFVSNATEFDEIVTGTYCTLSWLQNIWKQLHKITYYIVIYQ